MIHSSIIIVYVYINIWYCTVFSDKLVMATGHAISYADKPASIWMKQIIKNLHSMTCCYGSLHHWQYYNYTYKGKKL
jgi:ABC-type enterochelin transport system ATPase subunit